MPDHPKKPCSICRRWFRPNPRVGSRQRTCSRPDCQASRRKKTQESWRARNPDYFIAWWIQKCEKNSIRRFPPPLSVLPWDIAVDSLGQQGALFLGSMGTLLLKSTKDQLRAQLVVNTRDPVTLPRIAAKDQFNSQLIDSRRDLPTLPTPAPKDQIRFGVLWDE